MFLFIKPFWKRDITRHYDFSEKQSRVNLTRKSFFTRVSPENLLVTHDISSTTATFSSLAPMYSFFDCLWSTARISQFTAKCQDQTKK